VHTAIFDPEKKSKKKKKWKGRQQHCHSLTPKSKEVHGNELHSRPSGKRNEYATGEIEEKGKKKKGGGAASPRTRLKTAQPQQRRGGGKKTGAHSRTAQTPEKKKGQAIRKGKFGLATKPKRLGTNTTKGERMTQSVFGKGKGKGGKGKGKDHVL